MICFGFIECFVSLILSDLIRNPKVIWVFFLCCHLSPGVLDIPMISWVVMLVSRLLDYVATVEDEAAAAKKPLNGKDRERFLTGIRSL